MRLKTRFYRWIAAVLCLALVLSLPYAAAAGEKNTTAEAGCAEAAEAGDPAVLAEAASVIQNENTAPEEAVVPETDPAEAESAEQNAPAQESISNVPNVPENEEISAAEETKADEPSAPVQEKETEAGKADPSAQTAAEREPAADKTDPENTNQTGRDQEDSSKKSEENITDPGAVETPAGEPAQKEKTASETGKKKTEDQKAVKKEEKGQKTGKASTTDRDPQKKETGKEIPAQAEKETETVRKAAAGAVENSTTLPDGEYTDYEWDAGGGSGRIVLLCDKLEVINSHAFATIHFTKPNGGEASIDTVQAGDQTYTGSNIFTIPVRLNAKNEISARTVAMSEPHWVDYYFTITIDESDKEQVTALTVSNSAEGLNISAAELGVMKKAGTVTLRITAGDGKFPKLFLGTAKEAQSDEAQTISLSGEKIFRISPFKTDKKINAAFYSKSEKIWHDTKLIVDTAGKTLTITEGKKADYSKVEAAKAKVPKDLSVYKETRVKALNEALDAVVEGLYASEQERVDAFADAIQKAIAALEKEKLTIRLKAVDKKTGKKIKAAVFKVTNEKGKTVKADKAGVYSLADGKYTIKATAKNYENAVLKNYSPKSEETVTLELEPKEIIPEGTIIFKEDEKDPSKTNLFNTTGMFKVVKGMLVSKKTKKTLTVSLSGEGYHYLFKGTYEEALENGLKKKNWIKGRINDEGKWEFVIPLEESETFIPIVAVSESHLKKAENKEEELGKAFFARQLVLDLKKKTLTAGDYDEIADITVVSKTEKFKADSKGKMEIIGGPNSNNYACKPVIKMLNKLFSKAFIGTAENAQKDDAKTISLKKGKFSFEFVNSFGENGRIVMFEDKKPIAVAFFDTEENKWVNYKMTIDKAEKTVTIEALKEEEDPPKEPEPVEEDPEYKDDSGEETTAVNSETTLPNGVYTPKSFTFSGGTGKIIIACDKLEVRDGQAYATIRFTKKNGSLASVDSLRANGQTYSGFNVFTIPVELNANNKIVARTTAMSVPHWIEYSIFIAMDEPGKEASEGKDVSENKTEMDEEAPAILGLQSEGEIPITYSDLVRIFSYEGGYYLIEIDTVQDTARDTVECRTQIEMDAAKEAAAKENPAESEVKEDEETAEEGGSSSAGDSISDMIAQLYKNEIIKYLVIPEGKEVPAGLDKEVIIISQPVDKTYVSSADALEMIAALGAQNNIAAVGLEEEDVKNTEIQKAMQKDAGADGAILYAGPYDDWDLKTFITGKLNFAVQSSLILPKDEKTIDEDMENLVRLGQRSAQMDMAMFIGRSEDEQNALAAAEWYKVYGVLFGSSEQADVLYQDIVSAASDQEKEEAEALLKTRAEARSKMKAEAKAAAQEQTKEG